MWSGDRAPPFYGRVPRPRYSHRITQGGRTRPAVPSDAHRFIHGSTNDSWLFRAFARDSSVGNYEPYYVGRLYYEPESRWCQVYSFPVTTPAGVVYRPYIYDGTRVVFRDYIPGPRVGYTKFVHEGRGHYDPEWRRHDKDNGRDASSHHHHHHDQNGG